MAASIDVVVPVYNNYALTRSCLESLAAQSEAHNVIVVDDASSDGTAAAVQGEWPRARLVRLARNEGYTRAVNRGVQAGEAEFVVLLNNDVRVRADFLEQAIAPLRAGERVGAVATLMLAADQRSIDSVGVTADRTLAGFARLQGCRPADAPGGGPLLTGPEGTAGAYRRTAWEQAGGLDERIGAYMEILDLALRLRSDGWRAAVAADAVGVHLGSGTYGRGSAAQRGLAGFSRGYLLRRYGVLRTRSAPRALATELLVVAADALVNRDLRALCGRLRGWRSAKGLPRRAWPPDDALDRSISMLRSLALRRRALRPTRAPGLTPGAGSR